MAIKSDQYFYLAVLGRVFFGGFFLLNAIQTAINIAGTTATFTSLHVPYPILAVVLTVAVEAAGGLMLILNSRAREGALVLAVFILLTAPFLTNFSDTTQMAIFFQNMAIVGGLLYVAGTI